MVIYRAAVDFFIGVADAEWTSVGEKETPERKAGGVETLTIVTAKRHEVPYPFDQADCRFYKMPSYLRRAAINEAVGKV